MTQLLEQAISQVRALPDAEQDALAAQILQRLADRQWDALFLRPESETLLDQLANEALSDFRAGKTRKRDPGS
jgi:hypothetical protein